MGITSFRPPAVLTGPNESFRVSIDSAQSPCRSHTQSSRFRLRTGMIAQTFIKTRLRLGESLPVIQPPQRTSFSLTFSSQSTSPTRHHSRQCSPLCRHPHPSLTSTTPRSQRAPLPRTPFDSSRPQLALCSSSSSSRAEVQLTGPGKQLRSPPLAQPSLRPIRIPSFSSSASLSSLSRVRDHAIDLDSQRHLHLPSTSSLRRTHPTIYPRYHPHPVPHLVDYRPGSDRFMVIIASTLASRLVFGMPHHVGLYPECSNTNVHAFMDRIMMNCIGIR